MKLVYFLGLMCSLVNTNAKAHLHNLQTDTTGNTLLWEVSGNGLAAPSYLFGTFHLLCKDDIKFSSTLKQAITNSHEIYLELDLDDPATLMGALMLMNMKDGKKLIDLYTADQYKRVSDFFKDSLKTPISLFQRMKPEFLVALLYPKMMPCNSASSVEESVMQLAKEGGKDIKGLETMAFQASVFDSIPYEKQAEDLLNTIDSLERSKADFALMLHAYKSQRLDEIERIMNTPAFGVADNQEILLDNRNKNWILQLKVIMKKNPVFTAVGAGHLVGKNGLIALLRAEGYTVRGLENK
ncbi:MAG: TraB/GumN family protein [Ferruginibacter sp.]|nr:TraB/GumN family protein [Chitinophagaceae bacterium]